ncbi:leucine-rich repeat domain-containing protein [Finegoldia magna]|nr:leucine-rich repeat domain-containing protein [Finegoldia magna]
MNKKYTHTNEFTDLRPCLEYIYKNFGKEIFFSGRLTAYVKDLGPSIAECSVIGILEKENILNQIESICSIDINDRNILIDDIIYKLPIHLNKEAFRNTLEIVILSMGVELEEKKIQIQENSPVSSNTNDFKIMALEDDRDEDNNNVQKDLIIYQDDEGQTPANPPSDFEFDRSTGTIVKYLGQSKNVIIPAKIDGVQVKKIEDFCFAYGNNQNFEVAKVRGLLPKMWSFRDYIRIENVEIPQGVETIGCAAFYNNRIKLLKLPNSIKYIQISAFEHNIIETLNIPDSVQSIGNYAFTNNQIEDLTLGESLHSIGEGAFEYNKIKILNIPASVSVIQYSAFRRNQIKDLTLGENLWSVDYYAFEDNNIETLNIPASLVFIFDSAFRGNQIKDLTLGESLHSIGEGAFEGNKIETLNIPASVKSIGGYAFYDNEIKELTLGENLEAIGEFAFSFNKIKTLNITASVKSIGDYAFYDNEIKELTLGENLEAIGEFTFSNNKDDEGQTPANPPSDFEFDRSTGTIVRYLGQRKNVRIPEIIDGVKVKRIGDSAFKKIKLKN